MEAVGEFYNEDTDIRAESNHETKEVVFCLGEISVDVVHVLSNGREFCYTINEEGNRIAKFGFDVGEGDRGVFDSVVENASDNRVFVHFPFFEDLFHSERVNDIRFARPAELAFVRGSRKFDGASDTRRIFGLSGGFWLLSMGGGRF